MFVNSSRSMSQQAKAFENQVDCLTNLYRLWVPFQMLEKDAKWTSFIHIISLRHLEILFPAKIS